MLHDFRFAIRSLRRRPTFSATVILTLALGIGTSSAVFSLLDAALLKPLPFADPSRIAILWGVFGPQRDVRGASYREVIDWRELNRSFSDVAAYDKISLNLGTANEPRRVESEMVSASYFSILGVSAERGRTFLPDEDRVPDARPVALISHALWTTQFAEDPAIVGRTITLNDRTFTVVGVMKPEFRGISFDTDLWVPMMMISLTASPATIDDRGSRWLAGIGRLRPGVSFQTAQRDVDGVASRLAAAYPETNTNRGIRLFSLHDDALGSRGQLLVSLFLGVLLFLLVACANVINLQLVRATSRRREMALRVAVGADRARLFRQLLAEGLTLAAAGSVAGLAVAVWGLGALLPLLPDGALPSYVTPTLDWRVLAFAMTITLVCGVVFGLVPARQAQNLTIADALKAGSRSASGGIASIRRFGAQQMLVVSEIALALVLLIAGALMLRSLERQLAVEPGFHPDGVLSARLSLPRGRYPAAERVRFANALLARLDALPQVESAAIGSDIPLGDVSNGAPFFIDGVTPVPTRHFRHRVTPGYFEALGIPLLRGRSFTAADRDGTPLVILISDAMARRYWPSADPIGRRVRLGDATGPEAMVVGVVGTARFRDLTTNLGAATSEPDIFVAFAQRSDVDLSLIVKTSGRQSAGAQAALLAAIQREITTLDAGLPLYRVAMMSDYVARQTATGRFGSTVLGSFSVVALLLASIGIYGVLAFVIGLSRREIAIRMALGATRGRVVALIVRQGMSLVAAGVAIGLAGAFFATEALSSQLFGVSATDPATFVVVPAILAAVALAASYLPSRTAARIDPQQALKSD